MSDDKPINVCCVGGNAFSVQKLFNNLKKNQGDEGEKKKHDSGFMCKIENQTNKATENSKK